MRKLSLGRRPAGDLCSVQPSLHRASILKPRTGRRPLALRARRLLVVFIVWAIACGAPTATALAFEPGQHIPYAAGSAGGVPIGVNPPPGFYLSSLTGYFDGTFHTDVPPPHPLNISLFGEALTFLWVPDTTILGATYSALVNQGMITKTLSHIPPHNLTRTQTGLVNTVISPVNLSWSLPADFYVSGRFAVQLPDGQYNRDDLVNIANNFWAFEPNVGISYLKGGLDLSVRLLYDIVTENTDSNARGSAGGHYQSGNVFTGEFSATQSFGSWRFGLTGYGVAQTNDDSARGHLLKETEASRVGLGPIVEYNNKWVGINLYYIRDVQWNRAFGGDNFFFKVTVRF
jgi:hypothetical protein